MAIGNRSGVVRLYGRPGVDVEFKHEKECAIFQVCTFIKKKGIKAKADKFPVLSHAVPRHDPS